MANPKTKLVFISLVATSTLMLVALTTALFFQIVLLTSSMPSNKSSGENGLDAGMEAFVGCEAICPSNSMNCSEWNDCRFLYPDLCKGFITICRDPDGTGANGEMKGPEKAVLADPALQQYLQVKCAKQIRQDVSRMILYVFTMLILLILLVFIIRSKPVRRRLVNAGPLKGRVTGQGQGGEKVLVLTIGTTAGSAPIKLEDVAQIKEAVMKRLEAEGFGGAQNV